MLMLKVCCVLLFVVLADCGKTVSRQNNALKKELNRGTKRPARKEVFDNLFNIYDPSFLAVVWPKITNGMHILVDHTCWEELGLFFKELTDGKAWAYNALDASGRYGSGLFMGNRFWLGSKEQCLDLDQLSRKPNKTGIVADMEQNDVSHVSRQKYFDDESHQWRWMVHYEDTPMKVADSWPPYRLAYSTLGITLNITKSNMIKSTDITLGLCMPYSCSPRDITSVINFSIMINDNLKTNNTTSRVARITSVRRVQGHYEFTSDRAAVLLLCITAILVALVVTATTIDLDLMKCLPYGSKSMTFDLEKYNTDPNRRMGKENGKLENGAKSETEVLPVEHATPHYMAVDSLVKCSAPAITLDVNCAEKTIGSCRRCGKYRKQCINPRQLDNLPPCPRLKYNSFASLSTESKKTNVFCRLLLCFSLAYCWKRIFNTNTANKDLSLIHVMRVFATFWIMFVHVAVIVEYIADTALDVNAQNDVYLIIATGTIAFDTLFFVSGLFSSHHFFFLKSQYSVKELVGFQGACGQVLQFICFVTNRVIRLLPSYAYAVLLSGVLALSSYKTATLALPDDDEHNCRKYGWRNLLYITTAYPIQEQCMQISWYLSTETQLHMLGALLCAVSAASSMRARIAAGVTMLAMLAATIADASAAFFDFGQTFTNSFGAYAVIIERPWARVAPYFMGVFAGWLIHIVQGKLKVSKVTSGLLWMASISFMFTSSAVPLVGLPWLAAWLHLTWPIALLWPVLMGTTTWATIFRRLLARSSIAALSRLSYGMLLLHSAVARSMLLSMDSALCSTTLCIWLYFAGTTVVTLIASLLLSLLVEMPCCSLLRRLSDCAS
ncbi:uncharacterized protein LOC110374659 [Helicoverpa armigera]|uniref:uncharacterized protein LOC110374659 n=1 Tax=Helicoverpa armigera TaxID=29058 RepID=UPI00308335F4